MCIRDRKKTSAFAFRIPKKKKKKMSQTQKQDIYKDLNFYDKPYDQNAKFSVYIPKQQDKVLDLIKKENQKVQDKKQYDQFMQTDFSKNQSQVVVKPSFKDKLIATVEDNRNGNNDKPQQKQIIQQAISQQPQFVQTAPVKPNMNQTCYSVGRSGKQSNCFAKTGFAQTMYGQKRVMDRLRAKLYFDERTKTVPKTTLKNQIIENIVQDYDVFLNKQMLMDNIYKLKQLNLLKQHDAHVNKYKGIGKMGFVYNDYHSKSTNNGFSRNFGGVFYTR
eukprot:TRINITY_DN3035_c0_g1_i3.p1 TRINITY_DN3035_c0_g1~~TRINITY_DN3035_c0_g1_i3.p1  ORF type:complete len:275 (+),score=52.46 TRINITY_DN3035_c0_g1_i3:77-901(+)